MTLRVRLAIGFALVALLTAGLIALVAPSIIGRGFSNLTTDPSVVGTPGAGGGAGRGPGPMAGLHASQVQQETTVAIVALAVAAAAGASLLGFFLAGRIVRPLVTLESAADAVAHGDLGRRSGLADRTDELGSLGRSFDSMTAELALAEEARQRFFADAAHELKTPLSVIDATTAAILDGVYQHDDRHLRTIRDQSHLLGRIVDDLRTVSLAETASLPLERGSIAVDGLVRAALEDVAVRAGSAGITLRAEVPGPVVVTGDRDRLRQVLGALLDNALRHTPPGGGITVEVTPRPGVVRVGVRDTGPGVATKDLPYLFERFYQADPARDRATGTSGLGLAVVRALVMAHGGWVGAENAAGGGARFWFELPVASAGRGAPGPAVSTVG